MRSLANHDRELAAESFREGLKRFPDDSEFAFGLEQAGLDLPREEHADGATRYLDVALRANPNYSAAMLHKAEQLGGGKDFKGTRETLKQILTVNPDHPEAWAQLAAYALVEDDAKAAAMALKRARKFDETNA